MNKLKRLLRKGRIPIVITVVVALLLMLSPINVAINPLLGNIGEDVLTIGQNQIVLTIGTDVYAAGTADYTCDGVADDVQFQAALDALPPGGGKLVALTGDYVFAATVSRAIDNVTVEGMGASTYFAYDAGTALFTAGGNNWVFSNLRTDAGGIGMGATTGWMWANVTIGTTYYTLDSDSIRMYQAGNRFLHTYFEVGSQGDNTFVGVSSGNFTLGGGAGFGSHNTGFGNSVLNTLTTGYHNTAVGRRALYSNTTGYQNTAIGYNALMANIGGFGNTAIGPSALQANTSGTRNLAMAAGSLLTNTTGYSNVAIGTSSMNKNLGGYSNTAVGVGSILESTSGYKNVAMGVDALYWNTTGYHNVGLGFGAGGDALNAVNASSTDNNMVLIGYLAGRDVVAATSLTNSIAIGSTAEVSVSNQIELGNDSIVRTHLKGSILLDKAVAAAIINDSEAANLASAQIYSTGPGVFALATGNANNVIAVNRLSIGTGATAVATWANVTHAGFVASDNISMGSNQLRTTNLYLKEETATAFSMKRISDNAYMGLYIDDLFVQGDIQFEGGQNIKGRNTDGYDVVIWARDTGVGLVEVARAEGEADPAFRLGNNGNVIVATNGGLLGFFGAAPVGERLKANYNNWAAFTDVVQALVDLGLFDAP